MNTTSPFSFLESLGKHFQPPAWVLEDVQQRWVLFFNHVLQQEPQAQQRLQRYPARVVTVQWGVFSLGLRITPAGLLERADASAVPDLRLSLGEPGMAAFSPSAFFAVVQATLAGQMPPVKVEGDVQLAAEVGWLAENLRWDAQEDLARLLGDVPASALADLGRKFLSGLRSFLKSVTPSPSAATQEAPRTPPAGPQAPGGEAAQQSGKADA